MKRVAGVVLIVALLILAGCAQVVQSPSPPPQQTQSLCEDAGAGWKQFGSGCVDSCFAIQNPKIKCTQALAHGCDCGPDACWNDYRCQPNDAPLQWRE